MNTEILEIEKKYWDAIAAADFETVKSMTSFPCIVAGKRGVMSLDEPTYKKMMEDGKNKKTVIKQISNEQIQSAADHAMIAYEMILNFDGADMKVACTSTWVKKSDTWRCNMHTETDIVNP